MNDLDSRARAIVEAGRDADSPSAADRERIKRAVLVQIAAGSMVASTAVAGTWSVGAKVGLTVLAVALVGGGTVLTLRHAPPAAPTHAAPARAMPRMMAPAAAVRAPVPTSTPPEEKPRKTEKTRKLAAPSARLDKRAPDDQLTAEVEVLKRAREELRLGRPSAALAALGEYDRRFGQGVLGEEKQALAAIAACRATPGPEARAEAEAFMRRAPASPLRERVREACITPTPANPP
jgi:hypothetical protein